MVEALAHEFLHYDEESHVAFGPLYNEESKVTFGLPLSVFADTRSVAATEIPQDAGRHTHRCPQGLAMPTKNRT